MRDSEDRWPMKKLGTLKQANLDEAEELEALGREATAFLEFHPWCVKVLEGYFDRGFSKVAVFYFRIQPRADSGADPDVWVVVGDVPPAYLDTQSCPNGAFALADYIEILKDWADTVLAGEPVEDLMPVRVRHSLDLAQPTEGLARTLKSRMEFIERRILTEWQDELEEDRDREEHEAST